MESQVELNRERVRLREKFSAAVPEFMEAETAVLDIAYRDGELSAKFKRLITLGIALRARCVNCIVSQTQGALDAGATKGEILEPCYRTSFATLTAPTLNSGILARGSTASALVRTLVGTSPK